MVATSWLRLDTYAANWLASSLLAAASLSYVIYSIMKVKYCLLPNALYMTVYHTLYAAQTVGVA